MGNDKKEVVENIFVALLGMGLFFLSIMFMNRLHCISVIDDEFGYWTASAFFCGSDWKEIYSTNKYYSWGYGLLISPIYYFFRQDPSLMLKISIAFNALLIVGTYLICYRICIKYIGDRSQKVLGAVASAAAVSFPSYLASVNASMGEVLLLFLVVVIMYIAFEINGGDLSHTRLVAGIILLMELCIYIYYVHQRCIVFPAVFFFFILFLIFTNKIRLKAKEYLIISCAGIVTLFLGQYIKHQYKSWLYPAVSSTDTYLANDYNTVVGTVVDSVNGVSYISRFLINFFGKIYYSVFSTYNLVLIGVCMCFILIRRKDKNMAVYLAMLMIFLGSTAVSAVFLSDYTARTDILIYGRYTEYCFAVFILIGIMKFNELSKYMLYFILVFDSFLGILVTFFLPVSGYEGNIYTMCFSMAHWVLDYDVNQDGILLACAVTVAFTIIGFMAKRMIIARHKSSASTFMIAIALFIVFVNAFVFIHNYETYVMRWRNKCNNVREIVSYIRDSESDAAVYTYEAYPYGKMAQFLMQDVEIYPGNSIDMIPDDALILSANSLDGYSEDVNEYKIQYINKEVVVWKK